MSGAAERSWRGTSGWFDAALVALIPVAVVGLYHRVLGMWWTADDPVVLWYTVRFGPLEYFLDPTVWRSFSSASLTPSLILGLGVDRWLFDLDPAGFYIHQLMALMLASVALCLCLRLYLSRLASLVGALALVVAPPTVEIASNLATRHYVDGLTLTCLSFALFVVSLRRSEVRLSVAAAACYALVLTTKETYAPLPVILALLPDGGFRQRFRHLVPFAAVLAVYAAWRSWMLGSLVGGYRPRVLPTGVEASSVVRNVADGWGLEIAVILAVSLGALAAVAVLLGHCNPAWRWFWLGFAGCAVLPVVPILHVYSLRHGFAIAVLAASAIAAVIDHVTRIRIGTAGRRLVAGVVIVLLVAAASSARQRLPPPGEVQRVRTEGEEVLLGDDPTTIIVSPLMPYWYFFGLMQLRDDVLAMPPGPGVLSDECLAGVLDLDESDQPLELVAFDPERGRPVPMPPRDEPCGVDQGAGLEVDIRYDSSNNLTTWRFGPHIDGRYTVLWAIADNSLVGVKVPPAGSRRGNLAFEMGVDIVVVHRSLDGQVAVTPGLRPVPVGGDLLISHPRPAR